MITPRNNDAGEDEEKEKEHKKNDFRITPVQSTSLLVAYWRDLETNQTKPRTPLIEDPTARVLINNLLSPSQLQKYESSPIRPYGLECLAVRTRVMDDWLLQQQTKQVTPKRRRQLINLGAGMCCRPYRMDKLSYEIWFEIDSDLQLLNVKRSVLKAAGYHPKIPVVDLSIDLACPDTNLASKLEQVLLSNHHHETVTKTTTTDWIAEGLFAYLKPEIHTKLLRETAAMSKVGSRMALTIVEPSMKEFWISLGVTLPYQELVPVHQVIHKAKSFGWIVDQLIRPNDWSRLYPGRGEHLPGFHVLFLRKE